MTAARVAEVALDRPGRVDAGAFASAALLAQPFAIYLLILRAVAPATDANWAQADPILLIFPRALSSWIVPPLAVAVAIGWALAVRPSRAAVTRAARDAALGLVAGLVGIGMCRLLNGPHLPSFIPAEEGAGPGLLLSMTAGYGEEIVCRLLILPALYLALEQRAPRAVAVLAPVLLTGLAFALLHEAGSAVSSSSYFATRFLVPGCAMSLACLLLSPAVVISAHSAAHLLIPLLFV